MLKVLLVDDEPFIVQGLSVLIDWQASGFEIAGTAENGLEALEFLKKNKVDLIIADIKMPGMSGLALLETVRREHITDAYFAIVSGYRDFEYARTAICNACVDYILKPVRKEELLQLLARVEAMHRESEEKKQEADEQEKAYFSRQMVSVIYGKYDDGMLAYVGKKLKARGGLRYVAIEIDGRGGQDGPADEADKLQCLKRMYQSCTDALGENAWHCIMSVSRDEDSYDLGLIYSDALADEVGMEERDYLEYLLEKVRACVTVPVVMLVGSRVETLAQIGESFRSAAVAGSFQSFKPGVLTKGWQTPGDREILCKKVLDELIGAIEENQKGEITGCAVRVYEEINGKSMTPRMVSMNMNYLLFRLVHLAAEQDENVNQEEILKFIGDSAFEEGAIRGSRAHMIRFAGEFADYLAQLRQKNAGGVLLSVENEIRDNYSQNLTLKELSKKYYVNSAYLGQLFRKQHGMSFKDYLNNYRVDRAAELLLHSDMKLYEVAERVGYHDLDYFINRFIAVKGCTPARFRRQSRGQENK